MVSRKPASLIDTYSLRRIKKLTAFFDVPSFGGKFTYYYLHFNINFDRKIDQLY
jgi:hypothetical protein